MQHLPAARTSQLPQLHCRDLTSSLNHYRRKTTESSRSQNSAPQPRKVSAIAWLTHAAQPAKHVRKGSSRFLKQAQTAQTDNKIQKSNMSVRACLPLYAASSTPLHATYSFAHHEPTTQEDKTRKKQASTPMFHVKHCLQDADKSALRPDGAEKTGLVHKPSRVI